jgi:hypothetical protein
MVFSNLELMKKVYSSDNEDVVGKIIDKEGCSAQHAKLLIDRSTGDVNRMTSLIVAKDVAVRNGTAKIIIGGELVEKTAADIEAEIDASYDTFVELMKPAVRKFSTRTEREDMTNALIAQAGNISLNQDDSAILLEYISTGSTSSDMTGRYGNMPKGANLYKVLMMRDSSIKNSRVKPISTVFNLAMKYNLKFTNGKFI